MIYRLLIPLFAVVLFFLQSTFSLFSPIYVKGEYFVLVPHFFVIYLVFLGAYDTKKRAIIYGFIFGLLFDMYHMDMIGVYTVIYPLVAYLSALVVRHVHRNFAIVSLLAIALVMTTETLSYLFAKLVGFTEISLTTFLWNRLFSTTVASIIFLLLFGWLFRYVIVKRKKVMDARL